MENKLITEYETLAKDANVKWIDYVPEGGESREQVRNRVRKFVLETVCKDVNLQVEEGQVPQILVVCHGGVIRELFTAIFDEMKCELPAGCNAGDHKILAKNTSWTRFELKVSSEDYKIQKLTCTDLCNAKHLENIK